VGSNRPPFPLLLLVSPLTSIPSSFKALSFPTLFGVSTPLPNRRRRFYFLKDSRGPRGYSWVASLLIAGVVILLLCSSRCFLPRRDFFSQSWASRRLLIGMDDYFVFKAWGSCFDTVPFSSFPHQRSGFRFLTPLGKREVFERQSLPPIGLPAPFFITLGKETPFFPRASLGQEYRVRLLPSFVSTCIPRQRPPVAP